ncbi:hypothetical protein DB88DRAFT_526018 [Papiliotrema laurentii]|uniref:Uncharacterized protein n=1 Tax=Papiliotrema laurentii TaxID=5418 RepID=A0AAD9FS13_PAPLA|nr:hypothetical protein DB88DRAFT_526018 [Papiliotrema laurentii]
MPGQSSFTYTPPSCSPHASPPSNSFTTVLPSFDDLVASTLVNDTHPLTDSPSTFHQPKPLPFVHPRKTPQIPLMSLTPPEPAESPADIQRAPSTQSARTPPRGRPRQRAASAPAIYRRSTFGPASPLQSYKRCAEPAPEPGHALGLSRMSSFAEHHGDRVKEIRDGDGAFAVNDAVLPEVLPEGARPHFYGPPQFHGRHYSTTSLPPWISSYLRRRAQAPPQPEPSISSSSSSSSSYFPIQPIEFDNPFSSGPTLTPHSPLIHAHSFGSHSPLSTCDPLTPQSARPPHKPLGPEQEQGLGMKRQGKEQSEESLRGIQIPTLPRMR